MIHEEISQRSVRIHEGIFQRNANEETKVKCTITVLTCPLAKNVGFSFAIDAQCIIQNSLCETSSGERFQIIRKHNDC